MSKPINTPWQRTNPVDTDQGVSVGQTIALEAIVQQAGYSLADDVHSFYPTPVPVHNCDLCTRRQACAGNRSIRELAAFRPSGHPLTTVSIRSN